MGRKGNSRPARWAAACAAMRTSLSAAEAAAESFNSARADLEELKSEYEEWLENTPENLQASALGEKLQAVADLDLGEEMDVGDFSSVADEAEGLDLPRGFGQD